MLIVQSCLLALFAGAAAVGYGSGLARFLRISPNIGDRGILGLLSFGCLGCILHFAVALSTPIEAVVTAVGVIGAFLLRRDIRTDASIGLAGVAGLCFFVLLHPQAVQSYDEGLYYLQTFQWNRDFPITAGIGNLHGRLAFNSILFLIAPLTDREEFGWIPNFLAVTFVMLSLWARVRRIDLSSPRGGIQYWFVMLVISIFVLRPELLSWFGILKSDSLVAVLIAYWVALALGFVLSGDRRTDFSLLVVSAALASTAKISAVPLLAFTVAFGWFHRKERNIGKARVGAVAAAIVTVWMVRGVVLSGCAVYPVRQTCLSGLPWAVSPQQVNGEKASIRSWARRPGERNFGRVLQDWSWLPRWFDSNRGNTFMELLLAGVVFGALGVATAGAKLRMHVQGDGARDDLTFIAGGLAACLMFWFWSAPDLRFGYGFVFAAALFGLSLAAAVWLDKPSFYSFAPRTLMLLMAFLGVFGLMRLRAADFFQSIPEAAAYQLRQANDARLWVPRSGDQCWAHELPCTPYIFPEALARVRWHSVWPYREDPQLEPPQGWRLVGGAMIVPPKP